MVDEELRSVRVEVETETSGAPAPVAPTRPSRPAWIPIAVGAVVVFLTVAFFALRPEGDRAADGSERADPTASTVSSLVPTDEVGDAEPSTTTIPVAPILNIVTREIDEPVAFEQVDSPAPIVQILTNDTGLVALTRVESSPLPPLVSSVDGLVWTEVEATGDDVPIVDDGLVNWFLLGRFEEVLVARGTSLDDEDSVSLISEFGSEWRELPLPPAFSGDGRALFFLNAGPLHVAGLEFVRALEYQSLPPLLIETRDEGVCGEFEAVETEFASSDCADFSAFGSVVDSEPEVVESGNCDGSISGSTSFGAFALLDFERSGNDWVESVNSLFEEASFISFMDLGGGRLAVLDGGNPAIELCDGSGVLPSRDPGVLLVDIVSDRAIAYPAPSAIADDIDNFGAVLAEVQLRDRSTHLISAIGGAMWATDLSTGQWTALTEQQGDLGFQTPFGPQFAASESGERFYRIANNSLEIIQLDIDDDDAIRVTEITVAIDSASEVVSGFGQIVFATDEAIFYRGDSGLWRLQVPELPQG